MKHYHAPVTALLTALAVLAAAPAAPNADVASIAKEISAERVKAHIQKLAGFGTRHTLSDPNDPQRGVGAARNWLRQEMESYIPASGGRLKVEMDSFIAQPSQSVSTTPGAGSDNPAATPAAGQQPGAGPGGRPPSPRIPRPTELVNVVATLPGTDPKNTQVFVVGGHYDSMPRNIMDATTAAAGANDDASGTAVVLEAARVLSKRSFPATIVFIALVGEEQGLVGARHWAESAKQKGLHVTMLNNDIVGGNIGGPPNTFVRVFSEGVPVAETPEDVRARQAGGGEVDSPSRQLARYAEEISGRYLPSFPARMVWRRDRYGRGGDHTPFNEKGYAAVRFAEAYEDFTRQHQDVREENGQRLGDLPEFVSPEYIANVARINAMTLASLALAPPPPENARFVTERGVNNTVLSWEALPGVSYEIVWRDTTAPRWDNVKAVGAVNRYTFPDLPKDNYYFGIRAVSEKGDPSLVVFPKPPARRPPGEQPGGGPPPKQVQ